MKLKGIINHKAGTIVDVRTPGEFRTGNATDSVNFPLQEIQQRLSEIKRLKTPLVLCCASGVRSAMATKFLSSQGIECLDAGSWQNVNQYQSQTL